MPKDVNLCSSGNNSPLESVSSVIVLNLYNVKIFPFNPGRFCLNMTGEPNLSRTKTAVINNMGDRTINANNAQQKSCGLFIHFSYTPCLCKTIMPCCFLFIFLKKTTPAHITPTITDITNFPFILSLPAKFFIFLSSNLYTVVPLLEVLNLLTPFYIWLNIYLNAPC